MKKIAIIGGPCGGKTTVIRAIRKKFSPDKILIVPEVATILLAGGFPPMGKDMIDGQAWLRLFQKAVYQLQIVMEEAYEAKATVTGAGMLVCDRGLMDGASFLDGGIPEFCLLCGLGEREILARYDMVIHLESLAVSDPDKFGKAGNKHRYEDLARAQYMEQATKEAWSGHPKRVILGGKRSIKNKVDSVMSILDIVQQDPQAAA